VTGSYSLSALKISRPKQSSITYGDRLPDVHHEA
jgi:hypothetical protein